MLSGIAKILSYGINIFFSDCHVIIYDSKKVSKTTKAVSYNRQIAMRTEMETVAM